MRITFIFLISLLLSACSSAPTTDINYYLLDTNIVDLDKNSAKKSGETIRLNKLHLAHYLENTRLPLLQHDQVIAFASQHVWAEPLQISIQRILVNDFKRYSPYQLRLKHTPNSKNSDYSLEIHITHFSATDDASVILLGSYWFDEKEHSFHFKRELTADGFSHSVGKQRELIAELVKEISHNI